MPTATKENQHHKGASSEDTPPAGPRVIEPKGKVTTKEEQPEGVVIGEGGMITRPTVVTVGGGYHKEGNSDERFAGRILLKGKTKLGFTYSHIADVPQALTEHGLFGVFKAHFPDAMQDGFEFKPLSKDEVEKQLKEWAEEHEGKKPKKE